MSSDEGSSKCSGSRHSIEIRIYRGSCSRISGNLSSKISAIGGIRHGQESKCTGCKINSYTGNQSGKWNCFHQLVSLNQILSEVLKNTDKVATSGVIVAFKTMYDVTGVF